MPYTTNADLPDRVKGNLPDDAQSVYREAYTSERESGQGETRSHMAAWGAVKNAGYHKRDGKWTKEEKEDGRGADVSGSDDPEP